jgi:hypothetical protein
VKTTIKVWKHHFLINGVYAYTQDTAQDWETIRPAICQQYNFAKLEHLASDMVREFVVAGPMAIIGGQNET